MTQRSNFPVGCILLLTVNAICALSSGHGRLSGEQTFAMEPQDQVAAVGGRVILPCRVLSKRGVLQWTKDDFGLGTQRRLPAFDRYSMIGSDDEGDFSLQIYPVALDDEARYQCQVGPGHNGIHTDTHSLHKFIHSNRNTNTQIGEPGIRSNYAALTVVVSPDAPRILQGDSIETTEGHVIRLDCVSQNGKPAAEVRLPSIFHRRTDGGLHKHKLIHCNH